MIRLLTHDDLPAIVEAVGSKTAERCKNFLQGEYFKAFGLYDGETLLALICVHLNDDINAWCPFIIYSPTTDHAPFLLDYAASWAEKRGFYQWFTIGEVSAPIRYSKAVDERVPSHERPMTNVYWDWLFFNVTLPEQVDVIHYWLPAHMRPL